MVSASPPERLRPERRLLAAHHAVLRRLLEIENAVLPVSFGMVSDGTTSLDRMLSRNEETLRSQLEAVSGCIEMGIRLSWDVPAVAEYFVGKFPDLKSLRDRTFKEGREPRREDMMDLGRHFEELLESERIIHRNTLVTALSGTTEGVRVLEPRTERDVADLACLVKRDAQGAFEEAVNTAASLFDDSFSLSVTGPWAAYNFVELKLDA